MVREGIHSSGKIARQIAFSILALCFSHTDFAASLVPDGNSNTRVDAAQNGVPVVDIAHPNPDGVSRNTYHDFNIDRPGLILNNSGKIGRSQLGGAMMPNLHFSPDDAGATIILNEVTSLQRSHLKGYAEVFGKRAEFILANPNGISCNGCGFINTSRASLIAGSEINPGGAVGAFQLGSGDILIDGEGLNAANIDYLDLVARAIHVKAALQARQRLGLLSGNDRYDYAHRIVHSRTLSGNIPRYALDAGQFGSMYAGLIEIVATEAGVGVRTTNELVAQQRLSIQSQGDTTTGVLQAGNSLSINTTGILLQQGDYLAGQRIDVQADTLTLRARVHSDVNLRLVQRRGDWAVPANIQGGTGLSELRAEGGRLVVANDFSVAGDLSLYGVHFSNRATLAAGGDVYLQTLFEADNTLTGILYSKQNLNLNVGRDFTNQGQLQARGKLSLKAQGDVDNLQGGQFYAGRDLALDIGGGFSNQGELQAQDNLSLNVQGDVDNLQGGQFYAGRDLGLAIGGGFSNQGKLQAQGDLSLNVQGQVDNAQSGGFYARQNLDLDIGTSLSNQGELLAQGNLRLRVQHNADNALSGLLYAKQDLALNIGDDFSNRGELLAQGNLLAEGLKRGEKMASFRNIGGRVASAGNMTVRAGWFENTHTMVDSAPTAVGQSDRLAVREYYGDSINRWGVSRTQLKAQYASYGRKGSLPLYLPPDLPGYDARIAPLRNWREVENPAFKRTRGLIQADANLTLEVTNLRNNRSVIMAGKDMLISVSGKLENRDYVLREAYTESYSRWVIVGNECTGWSVYGSCVGGTRDVYGWVKHYRQALRNTANHIRAIIHADGTLTVHGGNVVNGVAVAGQAIGTPAVPANPAAPKGGPVVSSLLTNLTLPDKNSRLFHTNPAPDRAHPYLVETDPTLIDVSRLYGSEYFLEHVDYQPDDDMLLFIGDAAYEQRLIADQVRNLASQRYLYGDLAGDNLQYQRLVLQAAAAREWLGLQVGRALDREQIDALDADIVWYVSTKLGGYNVLVPQLYLSRASREYLARGEGARLEGKTVAISVRRLSNGGRIGAKTALDISTEGDLRNEGGQLSADTAMSLQAGGDIINSSRAWQRQAGADIRSDISAVGLIQAGGRLDMAAEGDIRVSAAEVQAGGDALLCAGGDIMLNTQALIRRRNWSKDGWNHSENSVTHRGSQLTVGGNVHMQSDHHLLLENAVVAITGDASLQAGGMLQIVAAQDTYHKTSTKSESGGWFSGDSVTTIRHATSTNIGSQLSGGNVSLSTRNGDIVLTGSTLKAKDKLTLNGAKNIDIQAGFNGAMNETHTKKSSWFSGGKLFSKSEDLEGKLTKTAVLATLSGKEVWLTAGKDMALKGVNVTTTGNLDGKAQNIAVENTHNTVSTYSKHEKLTVGFGDALKSVSQPYKAVKYEKGKASITLARAEFSKADKTTTKTTVVSSNLKADNITLTARSGGEVEGDDFHRSGGYQGEGKDYQPDAQGKGNINITGSNLVARNDVSLTAGNDVNIIEAKSTEKTASNDMKGSAELSLMAKNEYVQIGYVVNEAQKAKKNLKKAREDYQQYRQDLGRQRSKLTKLKAELANGKAGIEQADVADMASWIDDLKDDDSYYKANIALAAANLASKTVAVASQMAKAAQASGTYGFSASLELDIDALEKQFNAYQERSIASHVTANNITIAAGNTATVQGSDLTATEALDIAANDSHILASQEVNNSSTRAARQHLNMSDSTSGGLSGSISADRSRSRRDGITHQNSHLAAHDININTRQTTTIAGVNVSASDKLNIKTKRLDVASVQDSRNSRSNSEGFSVSGTLSVGVTGVGANMGMSHSRVRETVLTTLTGGTVAIDVAKDMTLKGATIAAVDKNGNDTGHLSLKTHILEVSSLNNTHNSQSLSTGLNVGIANQEQRDRSNNNSTASSVGIDFANDRANSKTKTLGTLGSGNIDIANADKSNTRMLNRDIKNNEIDIYDIKSHKGLKGTVDMRMFTEDGRNSIKEDIERSKRLGQAIGDVAIKDAFKLKDTFAHIGETQKDLDVQKAFALANGGKGIDTLRGKGFTIEQKQAAIRKYADIYAKVYDINIEKARIIATSKVTGGTHYGKAGISSIAINDNAQRNATDYARTMGHEVAHARIFQHKVRNRGSNDLNEQYAKTMEGYSAEGMQFSSSTYNSVDLNANETTNKHSQTASDTTLLASNDANWRANRKRAGHNDGKMDYRELYKREARVLDQAK
ncbi:MAG TPA: filamentous hemagglutinin N-terminal domain-containing protein, partial [Gammaproteobacteria bacterium]|nr:filamentous hemagglutinin N-terminal domain-containing protein [Gammaproteobacteria bacterium]